MAFADTLYLFTANDFLTFAIPTTLFATFGSLSGPVITTNPSPSLVSILSRIPIALLVVWANLLIFNISNQRSPLVVEDKVNKPHRPLPSGRVTSDGARRILLVTIPLVLLLGWALNCWQETLMLFMMTWMYNAMGGSDDNWVLRNLFVALGYGMYSSAALRVMIGVGEEVTSKGLQWVGGVMVVMFGTQHICDIKDVEGDKVMGRRSAPIVLGNDLVRWSVAPPVVVGSMVCSYFFDLGISSYVIALAIGGLVAFRTLAYRGLRSDKMTWKVWTLWICWLSRCR